jgi:predicted phosphodiesterase
MDLEQLLQTPTPKPVKANRTGDWSFTQSFDPHDPSSSTVEAVTTEQVKGDEAIRQFILAQGGIIPTGYRAVLVEARHQTHGWTRATPDAAAVTRPTWFYRFRIEPDTKRSSIDELVALVGKRPPIKKADTTTDLVLHLLIGDTQIGKDLDGDGTAGIIQTWNQSIDTAVTRWKRAGRPPVHIALVGDCIEGNQSQNGRNMWRSRLTVTEQTRILRRMLLASIDAFIAAPTVWLSVVNGNHDQVQRFQETRADDGHATEAAIAVADAIAVNPERYGHVKVHVPGVDEDHLVVDFNGTVMVLAHGHQWSRGKSMDWWAGQSFNLQAAQAGHILVHGHEHEFSIKSKRDRLVLCTPTMESESTWWKHKTGDMSKRGAILMFTRPGGEFTGLEVI